jgi:outer membrane protein OmpA-like peptidoglycan-associated protein
MQQRRWLCLLMILMASGCMSPTSDLASDYPKHVQVIQLAKNTRIIVASDAVFGIDSDKIQTTAYPLLDQISTLLNRSSTPLIELAVYTDDIADHQVQRALSKQRALRLKGYFWHKGVDKNRLVIQSHGHTYPIADNNKLAGRFFNRRIELIY